MTTKPPELELELDSILEKDPTGRAPVVDEEVMVFAISGDDIKGLSIEDLSVLSQPNLSFVSLPGVSPEEAAAEEERERLEIRSQPRGTSPLQTPDAATKQEAQTNAALSLKIAGKYKLEKKLAEGGEGIVYLARHLGLQLNPMRVIKFLPPEKLGEGDALKRFAQEIELTASLSQKSEHIVRIYDDFGISPELGCFYVMEYLDGCTLRDFLREYRPLPLRLALHVFKQLCHGLTAIHLAGILHQDIKPKNIFLLKRTDNPHFVKVGDFGIAKMPYNPNTHFVGNEGAGTPAYMAPEQLLGTEADFRTDIYALGLILFELVAGRKPFLPRSRTMEAARKELAEAHLHDTPPLLQVFRQDIRIPVELEQIVQRCLEKKREDRPDDVRDILQIVEKVDRYLRKHGMRKDKRGSGDNELEGLPLHKELPYLEDTPDSHGGSDFLIVLDQVKQTPASSQPAFAPPPLEEVLPDQLEATEPSVAGKAEAPAPLPTGMLEPFALDAVPQPGLTPAPPPPKAATNAMAQGIVQSQEYAPGTPPQAVQIRSLEAYSTYVETPGEGIFGPSDIYPLTETTSPPTPHNLSGSLAPLIESQEAPPSRPRPILPLMWISVVLTTVGLIGVWFLLSERGRHGRRVPSLARKQTAPRALTPARLRPTRRVPAKRPILSKPIPAPQRAHPSPPRRKRRRYRRRNPRRARPTRRTKVVIIERPRPKQLPGCPVDPPKGQWLRLTITPSAARVSTRHRQVPWSRGVCILRQSPTQRLRIRLTHTRYQPCLLHRVFARRKYHLRLRSDSQLTGANPSALDDRLDACLK